MNLDKSLSDIFVEEGYVTRDRLADLLASREDATESVGDILVRENLITEKQKLKCVGLQTSLPFIDLHDLDVDFAMCRKIPHTLALGYMAVPIEVTECAASVAMVNPLDITAIDEITNHLGIDVDPMWATEEEVRDLILRAFGSLDDLDDLVGQVAKDVDTELSLNTVEDEEDKISVIELREAVEGAPVVKLANALIARAVKLRASDIHIEPGVRSVRVRLRIDGLLQEIMTIPKELQRPLVSRIKVIAGLDIAERRMPQDGRCSMASAEGQFDFRVATYPGVFGEKLTIRVLDKQSVSIDLSKLGIAEEALKTLVMKSEESQGLILVTGPTGSGKTTTLYSMLNQLNAVQRHIITIEDPVEYQLAGIVQANVNPAAGVTFATGLRAILRQDPDVILVGESRDPETASTSIEAALTGHLVLTSLHANDSASAITRLIDMGVEPFLVGSSVSCSVAQRLLRVNCASCSEPYQPEAELLAKLKLPSDANYRRGHGCDKCAKTGYRGRIGVYEVLEVHSEMRRMILSGNNAQDVREAAMRDGMMTMRTDACNKAMQGITSLQEVVRVTPDERSL